jgi:hypothetical protein
MFAMMNPHRLFVDVGFEGVEIVRQGWKLMSHANSFEETAFYPVKG